jgi:hypothetical protein
VCADDTPVHPDKQTISVPVAISHPCKENQLAHNVGFALGIGHHRHAAEWFAVLF